MMRRWSGVQSSMEQRNHQSGLGLGFLCVEAFLSCSDGGLKYMPRKHG